VPANSGGMERPKTLIEKITLGWETAKLIDTGNFEAARLLATGEIWTLIEQFESLHRCVGIARMLSPAPRKSTQCQTKSKYLDLLIEYKHLQNLATIFAL
jgi:hypothetical protein